MNIKITDTILSIPPYLSTTWEHVHYLHMKQDDLIITLKDASVIAIQGLTIDEIGEIFSGHIAFLEKNAASQRKQKEPQSLAKNASVFEQLFNTNTQFKFSIGAGPGSDIIGQALAHNPTYADLPPLPPEVTNKIAALAKIVSAEDILSLPTPENNCNCIYCQINRVLRREILQDTSLPDHPIFNEACEDVAMEDLQFDQWDIQALSDSTYTVVNKLDSNEQYNVFLGEPIGCTCGETHCKHIIAVLRS